VQAVFFKPQCREATPLADYHGVPGAGEQGRNER
jgi:hypothetical protein